MPLEIGTRLGRYEVRELLGAGGMGEVYRAHDAKLDRDVAVKVLPAAVAESASAFERFQREARAVAALEHPNILAIHDFGVEDGRAWAAMELLRGRTLRQRLAEGPIPPRKAVELARQLAGALGAAHDRGIVHRDVKPENVFVQESGQTAPGRVKVLDFGLASDRAAAADPEAPTATSLTDPGTVMGTVGYMSPEQVRGEAADHRSDVFSFGCVLYEMLTGRRAFERDTSAETMTAVLRDDPPELATPTGLVPPALERIVRRCLEKVPAERFQSMQDLAFAIESSAAAGSTASGEEPVVRARRVPGVVLAGAAVLLAFVVGRVTVPPAGTGSVHPGTLRQVTFEPPGADEPSIAPDGKTVAFVRGGDIYVQRVGGENATNLTPDSPDLDHQPAFSPDGQRIAFRSERQGGGIYVMGATGESVRRVTDFGYQPAWSPDGKELVVATLAVTGPGRLAPSQLRLLDVTTGAARQISEIDAVQPDWSPSGDRLLFWGMPGLGEGIAAGGTVVQTMPAGGGEPTVLVEDGFLNWCPRWSADGAAILFVSDRSGVPNVWRREVDPATGQAVGDAFPVTSGELPHRFLTVALDGTLAFVVERSRYAIERAPFDLASLAVGEPATVLQTTRTTSLEDVSPSGDWILLVVQDLYEDLMVMRSDGTGRLRLTDSPSEDHNGSFGPDGEIYFNSPRSGRWAPWRIRRDGSGLVPVRLPDGSIGALPRVSPDGGRLAATDIVQGTVCVYDLVGPAEATAPRCAPSLDNRGMVGADWSPDGTKLVAGARTKPGRFVPGILVYTVATGEVELVRATGGEPAFLPDGRILFSEDGKVLVLDLSSRALRTLDLGELAGSDEILVSADGRSIWGWTVTAQPDVWVLGPGTKEAAGPAPGTE